MQQKMASRSPLVRAVASAISHVWFPATLAAVRLLPRRIAHPISRAVGGAYFRFRPRYRRAIRENLSIILGRPAGSEAVGRAASEMVRGHSSACLDFPHFALDRPRPP